jgi:hypothetical protein
LGNNNFWYLKSNINIKIFENKLNCGEKREEEDEENVESEKYEKSDEKKDDKQ